MVNALSPFLAGFQNTDSVILVSNQIGAKPRHISADVQLTDLAPIDTLSQRGGRLHLKETAPRHEECSCDQAHHKERTKKGLEVARRKGRLVGWPRVMDAQKQEAKKLLKEENKILKGISAALKVSRTTVFRYLKDD